jgi:hypothetical protein
MVWMVLGMIVDDILLRYFLRHHRTPTCEVLRHNTWPIRSHCDDITLAALKAYAEQQQASGAREIGFTASCIRSLPSREYAKVSY